ncbi:hypothetical protein PISMIDRAFT_121341, partial [Pisolithus microcarpus 441]
HTKAPCALQLQLLEEWCLNNDLKKSHCKLHVDPDISASLITKLENHPVFSNNSNNPQLPVSVQLAIFLNGVGHCGNGATTEDVTEWARVSIGTVYNCYCWVMIMLLQLHDDVIHFDLMELLHRGSRTRQSDGLNVTAAQSGGEGFCAFDGSPFNLFPKPGWHGEGFYDCKSHYSLSTQVCTILWLGHDT